MCKCGHRYEDHISLPGFPGGCEECQVGDCDCGEWRRADNDDMGESRFQRRRKGRG